MGGSFAALGVDLFVARFVVGTSEVGLLAGAPVAGLMLGCIVGLAVELGVGDPLCVVSVCGLGDDEDRCVASVEVG